MGEGDALEKDVVVIPLLLMVQKPFFFIPLDYVGRGMLHMGWGGEVVELLVS